MQNKNFIKISVKDKGIGIKDEDKEKLFVPFEMLENGKNLNPSGTGIGLSICHRMLTAIGCEIKLEESSFDQPGRLSGSTFSFTIRTKF